MILPLKTIIQCDKILRAIGAEVPTGYWDLSLEDKQRECNGIGSDSGNLKFLVVPTTFVFSWMLPLSLPHDIWWGIRNDGTRKSFSLSNEEFKRNGYKLADYTLGWVWPGSLRESLRNGRKFEARQARNILSSDECWKVFQESAQVDEGPEVQG